MLPGFRFLFAAIVLSMSVLVFGLGAAALLRAAHEEVASIPSRRAPPETVFAQPNEAARPVLAMLRVDPPADEPKASENNAVAVAPAELTAIVTAPAETAPAEPERVAALKPDDSSPVQITKPETPASEAPSHSEAVPMAVEAPAPADEIRIAATQEILPATNDAAPTTSEQASAPASPGEANLASIKIATLGGPPVTIEPAPRTAKTKADPGVIKKRVQARRATERRRPAQRARLARQAPAQPADPFAQPAATFPSR